MEKMAKPKYFKNENRNKEVTYTPYVPAYKQRGLKPVKKNNNWSFELDDDASFENDSINVHTSNFEYMGDLPNFPATNISKEINSIDGEAVDMSESEKKYEEISNEVEVETEAEAEIQATSKLVLPESAPSEDGAILSENILDDMLIKFKDLFDKSDCIMFIDNILFAQGSIDHLINLSKQLIFGTFPNFNDKISIDRIFIIKKINLTLDISAE